MWLFTRVLWGRCQVVSPYVQGSFPTVDQEVGDSNSPGGTNFLNKFHQLLSIESGGLCSSNSVSVPCKQI